MALTIPNVFAAGTTAKSGLVNGNFSTIATFINGANLTAANLVTGAIGASGNSDLNSNIVDGTTLSIANNQLSVATGGVGTSQIAAGAVTSSQIAAGAVTSANRAASNYNASVTTGAFTSTSSSNTAACNVGITASGRPVQVVLQPDGSGNSCSISSQAVLTAYWYYNTSGTLTGATKIAQFELAGSGVVYNPGSFNFVHNAPAAGSAYYLFTVVSDGSHTIAVSYCVAAAYDL